MCSKKRVLTDSVVALSAALSNSAIAAQTTTEVIDQLDAQQSQIDDNHEQLARQQTEADRLGSRLRAEIIDVP
ncbi:MAG: hypothetical protein ACI8PT_000631 [Gammaproteobacteria bacterium]|jgi:hypothetical protein